VAETKKMAPKVNSPVVSFQLNEVPGYLSVHCTRGITLVVCNQQYS
jgi:hypothetical protein